MTGFVHSFDQVRPGFGGIVNLSLTKVVSRDEESRLCVILVQEIKYMAGIEVWPVVKGQGHSTGNL